MENWLYTKVQLVITLMGHLSFSTDALLFHIQYGKVKLYSYPITSLKHEQERYCNLSFQKTEESVLKHHLLSPSIYKVMQR